MQGSESCCGKLSESTGVGYNGVTSKDKTFEARDGRQWVDATVPERVVRHVC